MQVRKVVAAGAREERRGNVHVGDQRVTGGSQSPAVNGIRGPLGERKRRRELGHHRTYEQSNLTYRLNLSDSPKIT